MARVDLHEPDLIAIREKNENYRNTTSREIEFSQNFQNSDQTEIVVAYQIRCRCFARTLAYCRTEVVAHYYFRAICSSLGLTGTRKSSSTVTV